MYQIQTHLRQSKMIGQRKPGRNAPYKWFKLPTRARLSLWVHPCCLSTWTLFPPNKHFTCFTMFCLYVEIHFYTADVTGPRHWPLVPGGLVARIQCSHCCALTSVSGQRTEILLQAAAGRGHLRSGALRWDWGALRLGRKAAERC